MIDVYPPAQELFEAASALLGRDLYALTMKGTQEAFGSDKKYPALPFGLRIGNFSCIPAVGLSQ
jgi:hypothetical protein